MSVLIWVAVVAIVTLAVQPWVRRRLTRDHQRRKPGLVAQPGLFPREIRVVEDYVTCTIHLDTTAFDQEMAKVRQHLRTTCHELALTRDPRAFIITNLGL